MSAPVFSLVAGQTPSVASTEVTLALTVVADPDNPVPGDLHLLNGQIHFWDGDEARYQKTVCLLRFVKGEWFLNVEEGIPYFTQIFLKNPDSKVVLGIMRKALLASPGAVAVPLLTLEVDAGARTGRIRFELQFDDGRVLSSEDFQPFIIGGL